METKSIHGIDFIIYEVGMEINNITKSFYFEEDLEYEANITCLNFYANKNVTVKGNQYVKGNQDVRGYQDVRFIKVNLFSKWSIVIDRDTENIGIGCKTKTIKDWKLFFKNKETYELESSDRNYLKLESSFKVACEMKKHLILMNDKLKLYTN
jgi:hypothetical protein